MQKINVFSAFDGISGAKVALDRLNISCNYYASEIDKYAVQISKKNHPGIIHVGDIKTINPLELPKIDLFIGGSPCQDLSNAGKGAGLKGERSGLFFEYVWLLSVLQPKYFLLENVKMKKEFEAIFNMVLGTKPIEINSALVSAQNRKRLYWTNIPQITQPDDKKILLVDIIEEGLVDRDKSYCIDANYYKGIIPRNYYKHHRRQIVYLPQQIAYIYKNQQGRRIYSLQGKSVSLKGNGGGWGAKMGLYLDKDTIRKLTPLECERLQTYPDNYTEGISNTQRYKCLGNSFTVDVIAHILSFMEF